MFKGFQQTGISRFTYSTSHLFNGFPSNNFAQSPNPWIVNDSIIAWWDTQNGVTLNGSTVSAWADKISGITMTQSTAVNQPVYIAADGNYRSYPSLNFNGSTSMTAGNVLNLGTLAGMTIMYVIKPTSVVSLLTKSSALNANSGGEYSFYGSGGIFYCTYYDTGLHFCNPPITTSNCVLTQMIDRTGGALYGYTNLNSALVGINTALTNFTPTAAFNLNSGTYAILEIIVYNRTLTAVEMNQNVTNLRAKYGF